MGSEGMRQDPEICIFGLTPIGLPRRGVDAGLTWGWRERPKAIHWLRGRSQGSFLRSRTTPVASPRVVKSVVEVLGASPGCEQLSKCS